jgi:hypothetical protein
MAFRRASPWLLVFAAFGALSSGCFLDASAYDGAGAGSGTTSGGAAAGGSGTGNGGSGAATSAGGTTGAAGGATGTECMTFSDCPVSPSMCIEVACESGKCKKNPVHEGANCAPAPDSCHEQARCVAGDCTAMQLPPDTVISIAPAGDCQHIVCDANGQLVSKADDADKPAGKECSAGACGNGSPTQTPANEGGSCGSGFGGCCAGTCCINATSKCCGAACCLLIDTCCPDGTCKGFGSC